MSRLHGADASDPTSAACASVLSPDQVGDKTTSCYEFDAASNIERGTQHNLRDRDRGHRRHIGWDRRGSLLRRAVGDAGA
jgi:hypothetical protein